MAIAADALSDSPFTLGLLDSIAAILASDFRVAAVRGASIFKMMDVSRHKSVDRLRGPGQARP